MSETPQPDLNALAAAARAARERSANPDPIDAEPIAPERTTPDRIHDDLNPDESNSDADEWQRRIDLENAQPPQTSEPTPAANTTAQSQRSGFGRLWPFGRRGGSESSQQIPEPTPVPYANESTRRASEEVAAQIAAMGSTVLEDEINQSTGQSLTDTERVSLRDRFDRVMHHRLPRILGGATIGEYLNSSAETAKAIPGAMLKTATSPKELAKMAAVAGVSGLLKTGARMGISQLGMFSSFGLTVGAAAGAGGLYSAGREIYKQFKTERNGARSAEWAEARARHRNLVTASWSYADKQRIGKAALRGAIKGAIGSAIGFEISDLGLLDSAGQFIADRTNGIGEVVKNAIAPSPDTTMSAPPLNNEPIPTHSPVPSATEVTSTTTESPTLIETPPGGAGGVVSAETSTSTATPSPFLTETPTPEPTTTPSPTATPTSTSTAETTTGSVGSTATVTETPIATPTPTASPTPTETPPATGTDPTKILSSAPPPEEPPIIPEGELTGYQPPPAPADTAGTGTISDSEFTGYNPTDSPTKPTVIPAGEISSGPMYEPPTADAPDFPNDPEQFAPDGIIELPQGSNPWEQAAKFGEDVLGRKLTNQEILLLTQELSRQSDISVPDWNIEGTIDHKTLPPGFKLQFNDKVLDVLKGFKS